MTVESLTIDDRMLRQAAERGLQVIVMSCDPDPYRAIADAVVELRTS